MRPASLQTFSTFSAVPSGTFRNFLLSTDMKRENTTNCIEFLALTPRVRTTDHVSTQQSAEIPALCEKWAATLLTPSSFWPPHTVRTQGMGRRPPQVARMSMGFATTARKTAAACSSSRRRRLIVVATCSAVEGPIPQLPERKQLTRGAVGSSRVQQSASSARWSSAFDIWFQAPYGLDRLDSWFASLHSASEWSLGAARTVLGGGGGAGRSARLSSARSSV